MKNNTELNNVRNIFYRNNYKKLFGLMRVMIFVNFILIALLIYFVTHTPKSKTFATNPAGKTSTLYAFDEPALSLEALLEWANQAAITIYNIDYLHYPTQLKAAQAYFSPSGWLFFKSDFNSILNTIISKKLRVTSVASGPPVLVEQGMLLGHYSWKIRMPLLVTYESASEVKYQRLMITIVITKVSPLITPKGIAIVQFYANERPPNFR